MKHDGTMAIQGETKLCVCGQGSGDSSRTGGVILKGERAKGRKKVYSGMDYAVHVARMRCDLAAEANKAKPSFLGSLLPGFFDRIEKQKSKIKSKRK